MSTTATPPHSANRWVFAAIVGLGWLLYWHVLDVPFLFDDWRNIVHDESLTHQLWPWGKMPQLGRCLGIWTFQLNYAVAGPNLAAYHLVNIAIHIAAACVLFDLVRLLATSRALPRFLAGRENWLAAATALIWLAHPLQTQAVTYIVQRFESLMTLFFLLTLYCTVRGSRSPRPLGWYVAAWLACFAGMATKEVMFACPLVVLLFDRAFLTGSWKESFCRRWGLYLSFLIPLVWLVAITWNILVVDASQSGAGFVNNEVTAWEYLRSQPAVLLHYLRLAAWPDRLILDYGWPVETSLWRIYGLGAVILLAFLASMWSIIRYPRIGAVAMAYFLILAPSSSVVPIADLAFEHRMYLPLACVVVLALIAAAAIAMRLCSNGDQQSRLLWTGTMVVVGLLGVRTWMRNSEYHDPVGMWERMAAYNPHHARHYCILAKYYQDAGRREDAIAAFERSLELRPSDHHTWTEYGNLFFAERDFQRAIELYRKAIVVNPTDFRAHANIGRSEMMRENYAAALAASREALRCAPKDVGVIKQVAWLLCTAPDDELRDGREALRLVETIPQSAGYTDIQWQEVHAAALAEVGRFDDALKSSHRAVAAAEMIQSKRLSELKAQLAAYKARKPWRLHAPSLALFPSPSPSTASTQLTAAH